jgi:hypothetical protein
MSEEQAIKHRKTHRKQYPDKARRVDKSCRCHGSDAWSAEDRLITGVRQEPAFDPADPLEVSYRHKPKNGIAKESTGKNGFVRISDKK